MKILPRAALHIWTAALVVLVTAFGSGSAVADPDPSSLRYTCPFPVIGDEPMTASVVWDASHTHVVGRPTPLQPIRTAATVGSGVVRSLRFVGAATVEGTAEVHAVVAAPEGNLPVTVRLKVARTAVRDSDALTVPASGTLPSFVFHRSGPAKIIVGAIDLHLTPRNADGDETLAGKIDTSCDLNSGQSGLLATFKVVPASTGPSASGTAPVPGGSEGRTGASGAPGTAGGPGKAGTSGAGSASASASASSSAKGKDPSGSPSGTAMPSQPGAPGTPAADDAPARGAHWPVPVGAVAAFLVVSAVVVGIGWWGRRSRTEGRDE
ncbi:DUF6801 domain-containing protein [Streptomyces sp. NPDC057694]|uniref:DUF6801 domain-containing protein n=1 Tax=Streptomyces sp. NPDC057694 TaxID=3346216 RepID=UPI0036A85544